MTQRRQFWLTGHCCRPVQAERPLERGVAELIVSLNSPKWNRNIAENSELARRIAELPGRPGVYACTHWLSAERTFCELVKYLHASAQFLICIELSLAITHSTATSPFSISRPAINSDGVVSSTENPASSA